MGKRKVFSVLVLVLLVAGFQGIFASGSKEMKSEAKES